MRTLRQYWERIFSRLKKPSEAVGRLAAGPDDLERGISALSDHSHALADEVRRVRTDFERARDEESRRIADLEQVHQNLEHARVEDHRKLSELESLNSRFEAAREADGRKLLELDRRLAGIEAERNQARDRIKILEDSLTKATARLETTAGQIRELQAGSVELVTRFEASLIDAGNRFEATDNQLTILGIKLENERQHAQKAFDSILGRFRKLGVRLNWAIAAAGFAVLLGTVAGAVLIWDVQKNAALLAGMSRDIKDLMASVNQSGVQKVPGSAQPPLPARAPRTGTTQTVNPAGKAAATTTTVPSAEAAIDKTKPDSLLPGSAGDRVRSSKRLGVQQATRQDATAFFAENAKVEGMISLASGVQYRVVKSGSGESPSLTDQVVVSYIGSAPDGPVFDETYTNGTPVTFSMSEVTPAWREVLLKMQEGAEFELYVPPKLATSGGTRKRSMLGFEPSVYLIELQQVVKNGTTDPPAPAR